MVIDKMSSYVTADYLEQLRADADDVRADLAERERQLDEDPLAAHDAMMQEQATLARACQSAATLHLGAQSGPLVYKTTDQKVGRPTFSDANDGNSDDDLMPFTDDQVEAISTVMVLLRREYRDAIAAAVTPLLDRVKFLEQALMLSNGNNNNGDNTKLIETETVRKLCLQQH